VTSLPIRYVLNLRNGTLHDRRNLYESCNTDDIERRFKFTTDDKAEAKAHLAYRKDCRWCMRTRKVANPDAAPA